jgi:hypothetical protein
MKRIILITILFWSSTIFSQTVDFKNITTEGNYTSYITKAGKEIKIGDFVEIKFPRAGNAFTFITQGNEPCGVILSNTKNKITKIKVIGNETRGYKTYLAFKGYGLLPIFIEYENALETGEISNQ